MLGPLAVDVMKFEPKLAIGSSGTLEDIAEMVAARRDESVPRSLNQLTFSREEFDLYRGLFERAHVTEKDRAAMRQHEASLHRPRLSGQRAGTFHRRRVPRKRPARRGCRTAPRRSR